MVVLRKATRCVGGRGGCEGYQVLGLERHQGTAMDEAGHVGNGPAVRYAHGSCLVTPAMYYGNPKPCTCPPLNPARLRLLLLRRQTGCTACLWQKRSSC